MKNLLYVLFAALVLSVSSDAMNGDKEKVSAPISISSAKGKKVMPLTKKALEKLENEVESDSGIEDNSSDADSDVTIPVNNDDDVDSVAPVKNRVPEVVVNNTMNSPIDLNKIDPAVVTALVKAFRAGMKDEEKKQGWVMWMISLPYNAYVALPIELRLAFWAYVAYNCYGSRTAEFIAQTGSKFTLDLAHAIGTTVTAPLTQAIHNNVPVETLAAAAQTFDAALPTWWQNLADWVYGTAAVSVEPVMVAVNATANSTLTR